MQQIKGMNTCFRNPSSIRFPFDQTANFWANLCKIPKLFLLNANMLSSVHWDFQSRLDRICLF